ncbi:MAG: alpha/beta fold hydrolase [Pseudomonadales bacterium]
MEQLSLSGTAYELAGPVDAPVVTLIHGLGLSRQITWEKYVPALANRYRVLIYDLSGHGQSALPTKKPSLTVLAEQLGELLDELGIAQTSLVGFSLGGMINRRFAIDNPGRCNALAILNSPHEREPHAQRLAETHAAQSEGGGPAATIDAALERWFTSEFNASHPSTVQRVRETVLANNPGNYALHRQVLASGVTELIRPQPALNIPSLVATCEFDSGSTPAMTEAIASEISGASSLIVPGLKHLGLLERPELFLEPLLTFLDQYSARSTA